MADHHYFCQSGCKPPASLSSQRQMLAVTAVLPWRAKKTSNKPHTQPRTSQKAGTATRHCPDVDQEQEDQHFIGVSMRDAVWTSLILGKE